MGRTHPDLVGEHHLFTPGTGLLAQGRVGLLDPLPLDPRIGFGCAPGRELEGQPPAAQDLAYAPVGEGSTEQLLDQSGDLEGGPQGSAQPQLLGLVVQECLGQGLFLGGGELGALTWSPTWPARAQAWGSVCLLAAASCGSSRT